MTSTHRQLGYALLSVAGLLLTWYFNLRFAEQSGGFDISNFVRACYANAASSSISNDVTVAAFAFLIWSFGESRRIGLKHWWPFPILTIGVALAFAFPLFLLIRERRLQASSREASAELLALETRLLDPAARRSLSPTDALLADEFFEIGRTGQTYDKHAAIAALAQTTAAPLGAIDGFRTRPLTGVAVLATYRIDGPRPAWRSSIWQRRNGAWQIAFHQGTPVADRPPQTVEPSTTSK